jgi:hypothetical protein
VSVVAGFCRSGPSQGLEVLLDAETYDNGDPDAESDGFHVLITDNDDASLVCLSVAQTSAALVEKTQQNKVFDCKYNRTFRESITKLFSGKRFTS